MSWLTELRKPYEITDNDYKYRGKFFGRVSSMGASKVVVYVPQALHEEVMKNFKGKTVRVILKDAE